LETKRKSERNEKKRQWRSVKKRKGTQRWKHNGKHPNHSGRAADNKPKRGKSAIMSNEKCLYVNA